MCARRGWRRPASLLCCGAVLGLLCRGVGSIVVWSRLWRVGMTYSVQNDRKEADNGGNGGAQGLDGIGEVRGRCCYRLSQMWAGRAGRGVGLSARVLCCCAALCGVLWGLLSRAVRPAVVGMTATVGMSSFSGSPRSEMPTRAQEMERRWLRGGSSRAHAALVRVSWEWRRYVEVDGGQKV